MIKGLEKKTHIYVHTIYIWKKRQKWYQNINNPDERYTGIHCTII